MHFAYDASNKSVFVGLFSSVNESVWEHLKLSVIPISLFGIVLFIKFRKNISNSLFISFIGSVVSMLLITTFHYIGKAFGISASAYHIANYILSMFATFKVMYIFSTNKKLITATQGTNIAGTILTLSLITVFVIFTFFPPKISLMQDPITKTYGVQR